MPKQVLPEIEHNGWTVRTVHVPFWTRHGLSGLGCRLIASPFRASYCDGLEKAQAVCLLGMHVPCRESSNRATQAAKLLLTGTRPYRARAPKHLFTPPVSIPLHVLWYLPASIMPCHAIASLHCQPVPLFSCTCTTCGGPGTGQAAD